VASFLIQTDTPYNLHFVKYDYFFFKSQVFFLRGLKKSLPLSDYTDLDMITQLMGRSKMNLKWPSASQVELANIRVIEQVLSSALKPIISHLKDITIIRIFQSHGRFLLYDEAGETRFLNFYDFLKDCLDPFWRETEGRLVQQKKPGLDHEGSG